MNDIKNEGKNMKYAREFFYPSSVSKSLKAMLPKGNIMSVRYGNFEFSSSYIQLSKKKQVGKGFE